jgi:hypothetical protein
VAWSNAERESGGQAHRLRVVMEAMRHSDLKLTMKIYTDVSQLPLAAGVAALPSFGIGETQAALSRGMNQNLKIAVS